MDPVILLLVISTFVQHAAFQDPYKTSFRAVVELVSGHSRIFTGEGARLRCSIPDLHKSTWNYQWFRESEQLAQSGETLVLWNVRVKDNGKFYCQGVRDSVVGTIYTLQSLPVEISVDGGWAILQVPPRPGLVGETITVTCRVRGNPQLQEVILYKDNAEIGRQKGPNPQFHLTNLTLEDQGMYSCQAAWDIDRRTHSVISVKASVQVLEVLSQPVLEIVTGNGQIPAKMMKLICHLQYNARAPAPPLHYYFYRNNNRLGTATSENHDVVRQTPGHYSCKAKVPQLGINRWSEPTSFRQVAGPNLTPPVLQPRAPRPAAPPVPSPRLTSRPPAAKPTEAQPLPHEPTTAPHFTQPSDVTIQSTDPTRNLLLPSQSAELSSTQSISHTASTARDEPVTPSHQSTESDGASGDMPTNSPL